MSRGNIQLFSWVWVVSQWWLPYTATRLYICRGAGKNLLTCLNNSTTLATMVWLERAWLECCLRAETRWDDRAQNANNDLNGWCGSTLVRRRVWSIGFRRCNSQRWRYLAAEGQNPNMLLSVYNTGLYPARDMPSPSCQPMLRSTRVNQTKTLDLTNSTFCPTNAIYILLSWAPSFHISIQNGLIFDVFTFHQNCI